MNQPTNMQEQKNSGFPALLNQFKGEIAKALPKHLSADRMARIALTAFRRNPALGKCDPRSVFAAVIQASQLGLEMDTLGQAYPIPYGRECQFVPGWRGLVELVNRSGRGTVWTGAVYEGDDFEWALGDTPFVRHRPRGEYDLELMTHAYAVGRAKGSEWPVIEVWPVARVIKHRDRYNKVGSRHYSFDNFEMYARKVVLLQVLKYIPMSPELSTAIELNDAAEVGKQRLSVDDAIDGTWVPVPDDANEQDDVSPRKTASVSEKVAAAAQEAITRQQEDLDAEGEPWDPEMHAPSKAKNKSDGKWRKKRSVQTETVDDIPPLTLAGVQDELNRHKQYEGGGEEDASPGFPEINSAIQMARDLEELDDAIEMISFFTGPGDQLEELEAMAADRKEGLWNKLVGKVDAAAQRITGEGGS